ncbi:MAG: sensor domain-containing protein [Rhodococcus sp. (in: high G+C Gram-positive bacteria)]
MTSVAGSTPSARTSGGPIRTAGVAVAAMSMFVLVGCGGSTVSGVPEPGATAPPPLSSTSTAPSSTPPSSTLPLSTPPSSSASAMSGSLTALTIDPSIFPAEYQAVVLPPQAVAQAAQDLDGIATGASVDPAGCKPEPRGSDPDSTSLVVGTGPDSRATISVELARVNTSLEDRKALWEQCSDVTASSNGVETTVSTELVPPKPLGGADTAALRRTVTSGGQAREVTQSMLSLIAQVDDIRITATNMSFGEMDPDAATLDRLFTAAVQKVQAGG